MGLLCRLIKNVLNFLRNTVHIEASILKSPSINLDYHNTVPCVFFHTILVRWYCLLSMSPLTVLHLSRGSGSVQNLRPGGGTGDLPKPTAKI